MSKKLGKKNTAKRKIQMREYFTKQMQTKRFFSDPLKVPTKAEDSEIDEEISVFDEPLTKKITLNVQQNNHEDEENSDEIFSGNINLDDADRFVASLGLRKKKKIVPKKPVVVPRITTKDAQIFKKEAENLARLREVESQGGEEEEDDNIM